jgi:4-amino-4-deoxy-L-arabinose transferase-like glycosyltransferase
MSTSSRTASPLLIVALLLAWGVGMFARGFWTPDEPREADIAWRMSWQEQKAVPLLAGEAFCEKPPFTYWLAAPAIRAFGLLPWAARLPNLLYAALAAWSLSVLGRQRMGRVAAMAAAAAMSTMLLSYQVAIWFATDAPLLAAVSVALLGAYRGLHAGATRERLGGYTLMHAALAVGFLSKSAAAWLTPVLAVATVIVWERRWRELLRWELYAGLLLQAAVILPWIWAVYSGSEGGAHLRVFFWNNLAGRIARVQAPEALQYAGAHRNSPGKYLLELPLYLFPWTFLVAAAIRRAWLARHEASAAFGPVRFAVAVIVPTLVFLSLAATARNIYFATALPGVALLLAWWVDRMSREPQAWDMRAVRATSIMLLSSAIVTIAALVYLSVAAWSVLDGHVGFIVVSTIGLAVAVGSTRTAWRYAPGAPLHSLYALCIAYCALLIGPLSQVYRYVDGWQDLRSIAQSVERDTAGRALVLLTPDETTRAIIDSYARTVVTAIPGPLDERALQALRSATTDTDSRVLILIPGGRRFDPGQHAGAAATRPADLDGRLPWLAGTGLQWVNGYALPNGRRYGVFRAGT